MVRYVTAALALALLALPAHGWACTIIVAVPRQGETQAQAELREQRETQEQRWREADVVFLGEVVAERLINEARVDVTVRIVASISGETTASQMIASYNPSFTSCGRPDFPRTGNRAIFYADRQGLPSSLLAGRQLRLMGYLHLWDVRDPQIPVALRAVAQRLREQ